MGQPCQDVYTGTTKKGCPRQCGHGLTIYSWPEKDSYGMSVSPWHKGRIEANAGQESHDRTARTGQLHITWPPCQYLPFRWHMIGLLWQEHRKGIDKTRTTWQDGHEWVAKLAVKRCKSYPKLVQVRPSSCQKSGFYKYLFNRLV